MSRPETFSSRTETFGRHTGLRRFSGWPATLAPDRPVGALAPLTTLVPHFSEAISPPIA